MTVYVPPYGPSLPDWMRQVSGAVKKLATAEDGNPLDPGGLTDIAPDVTGTLANRREHMTLSGSRTVPAVSRSIEVTDGQSAPASSAGVSTASSASYGLSVVGVRPSWATSAITGEMDGISIWLRQANGDTAGILSNIAVRSGFAATLESLTASADNTGATIKGVRTQVGVVNSRDGGEFGFSAIADTGTVAAAFRAQNNGSAVWTDFYTCVNSGGTVISRLRGSDGSYLGPNTVVTGAATTTGAGQLAIGSTTATSATAGTNGAVPAQVLGYLIMNLAGASIKVPYYAA